MVDTGDSAFIKLTPPLKLETSQGFEQFVILLDKLYEKYDDPNKQNQKQK